jgi:hypothetical protein
MRPKPWSLKRGFVGGLIFGTLIWWSAFEPALGAFQKPQLLVVPAAIGILIVILRNRIKGVSSPTKK